MTELSLDERPTWLRHPGLTIGAVGSLLFLLLGFLSVAWTPHAVDSLNVGAAMQGPSGTYWLGTDHLGRDVLSLLMRGTLTSFVVAAVAAVIGAALGVPLGLAAAAWGGPAEWISLRITDFFVALPALIVAILLTAVYGPSTVNVMVAVGLFNIPAFARAAREGLLEIKSRDYLAAARLAGMSGVDIARRHLLPALANLIFVQAISQLAFGILTEAGLSYVGLGAQLPVTSLGLMLKDAQTYATLAPMLAILPGLVIVLTVIALNLTAEGLRDQLGRPFGEEPSHAA